MKKRILSVIALILAALMLCSCAGNVITGDGTDTDTSDTTTASSTSDTSDTSVDTSDDPADTSDTTEAETTASEDTSGTTSEPETTSAPETTGKGGKTTTAAETTAAPEDEPLDGSEGLEYELKGKSYTVTGIGTCTDAELVVPSRYMGKPVTAIAPGAFRGCDFLTSVYTPDSVTSIGNEAFADCPSIVSLDLGCLNTTLHWLFDSALYMEWYEYEDLPIDDYSFEEAYEGNWSPFPDDRKYEVMTFGEAQDGFIWFRIPKSLKKVSVRGGSLPVDIIKLCYAYATHLGTFFGFRNVEEITVPDSLTSVSPATFAGCVSLKYHEENGLSFVGSKNNPRLILVGISDKQAEKITVPDGCRIISSTAKAGYMEGKKSIFYNRYQTSWDISIITNGLFQDNKKLKTVSLPDGLLYIDHCCFKNCTALETLVIPKSVTSIENSAFYGCTSLKEITLPKGLTKINQRLFSGCSSLISVNLPDTIQEIGSGAFLKCTSLAKLHIPNGVRTIGDNAFRKCSSLTGLHLPDGVSKIGDSAFAECKAMTELNIPKSLSADDSYFAFVGCNPALCNEYEGLYFIGTEAEPYKYVVGVADTGRKTYEVPEGAVSAYLDYSNQNITELKLPKSLKHIEVELFGIQKIVYAGTSDELYDIFCGDCVLEEAYYEEPEEPDPYDITVVCSDKTMICEIREAPPPPMWDW